MFAPRYFAKAGAAPSPASNLPYQGETTAYDGAGATGSVTGGALIDAGAIYDSAGAIGSVSGATVLPSEVSYT